MPVRFRALHKVRGLSCVLRQALVFDKCEDLGVGRTDVKLEGIRADATMQTIWHINVLIWSPEW